MPRSLPLSPSADAERGPGASGGSAGALAAADSSPDAESAALSGRVDVFDPAMCCPTGLCGPGVDPALLQLARDLRWLTARGVTVRRVGLSQEPQAFVANARVAALLGSHGEAALPAVLVNDAVLTHGRYPRREELLAALASAPIP